MGHCCQLIEDTHINLLTHLIIQTIMRTDTPTIVTLMTITLITVILITITLIRVTLIIGTLIKNLPTMEVGFTNLLCNYVINQH